MHKHILFFLLIIANTTNHGMKRPNIFENDDATNRALVLFDRDLLLQITAQICQIHKYQPDQIKKNIRLLSDTNTFFHNHFAQEKVQQQIIDLCIPHNNSNNTNMAQALRCRAIHDKLENLTNVVRDDKRKFTQDDLADAWYLSATTTYSNDYNIYQEPVNQSLLYIAIDHWGLQKAITILDKTQKLHFEYGFEQNPLLRVAEQRARLLDPESELHSSLKGYSHILFSIAKKLLQKKFLPDGRTKTTPYTPLCYSVQHADTELTQLLLEHNADPYLIGHHFSLNKRVNAFDLEPEKGWLQAIIDEVNEQKNLKMNKSHV